jgi:hypothetical protein
MYGPVFNIRDKVAWDRRNGGGPESIALDHIAGPFIVVSIENNDDPDACSCGASRENGYRHEESDEDGSFCGELPAQWITVKEKDSGNLLEDSDGKSIELCSSWFALV